MLDLLDFNSHKTIESAVSDAINGHVNLALTNKRSLQEQRSYLGASAVGDACERRVQFDYAGAKREKEFEPKTLRIFDRGHVWEEIARCWLRDAGFDLRTTSEKTGKIFSFSQMDGRFKGHVDGVIVAGPKIEGVGYPCLWEHKAVGAKSYTSILRNGLAKERPAYADQVAIYQAYIDGLTEHPAIFSITNCDTCEQTHLPIPFDAERAQRASDRAVRIIESTEREELLPRPFGNRNGFECRMCAFADRCWSLPA